MRGSHSKTIRGDSYIGINATSKDKIIRLCHFLSFLMFRSKQTCQQSLSSDELCGVNALIFFSRKSLQNSFKRLKAFLSSFLNKPQHFVLSSVEI